MPMTDEECRDLRVWADAQPPQRPIPAAHEQIAKHLEFIEASLPTRNSDELSGKRRAAVYIRMLEGNSDEALAYMTQTAIATLDWFPTVHQCLAFLAEYRPPQSDRELALSYCHRFTQDRFEEWLGKVKDGTATDAEIEGAPDQWRRIAVEQCLLRPKQPEPQPVADPEDISDEGIVTPEQIAAIKAEFGISTSPFGVPRKVHDTPPRVPTAADIAEIMAGMVGAKAKPVVDDGDAPDIAGLSITQIFEQRDKRRAAAMSKPEPKRQRPSFADEIDEMDRYF